MLRKGRVDRMQVAIAFWVWKRPTAARESMRMRLALLAAGVTAFATVATTILAAEGSRFDHLVQEVLDGHRSASTTTEAEDYGRKDTTGISGIGGYERKERSQVAERSAAVGEEESQLANAPGCVLGGVGGGDSAAAAQGCEGEVAGDSDIGVAGRASSGQVQRIAPAHAAEAVEGLAGAERA